MEWQSTVDSLLARWRKAPDDYEVTSLGGALLRLFDARQTDERALELLRDFETAGRRIVVCGDMADLGDLVKPEG